MKRSFSVLAVAVFLAAAAVATAAPSATTITIRHQIKGCHTWSVNNGPYKAAQSVAIAKGGSIHFVDMDVMPHKLVQLSGPALKLPTSANMHTMMGSTTIVFTHAGTYTFTTKPGEDYKNVHAAATVGEDNVLKLKVVVS